MYTYVYFRFVLYLFSSSATSNLKYFFYKIMFTKSYEIMCAYLIVQSIFPSKNIPLLSASFYTVHVPTVGGI